MNTQRAIFRSLLLVLGCAALAACVVKTTSQTTSSTANGANPGYGNETRDHRSGENGGVENPCGGAVEVGALGQACGEDGTCADGLECMKYYGIAGPNGPEFTSCEMRCEAGCPTGTECVTISDGPGQVCRATTAAAPTAPTAGVTAAQGEKCGEGITCADGTSCVEYYGFAGPSGPKFATCEMRCGDGGTCPLGQACTTISDGPGTVCRPESN